MHDTQESNIEHSVDMTNLARHCTEAQDLREHHKQCGH